MDVSISVRQLLQTAEFRNGKVIAGSSGLDRRITRITVSELPNAPKWLHGGELVCSTGYHFQEDPQGQLEWVRDMYSHGAAAMVIKPHDFLGEVSQQILDLADKVGFPIIVVPVEVTWATVIQSAMDLMLNIQTKRILESYDIHHRLVKLVLSSGGLEMILRAISQIASSTAIVEDRFFKTMAVEGPQDATAERYIATRLSESTKAVLRKRFGYQAPDDSASVFTIPLPAAEGEETVMQTMIPIVAGEYFFGWLTLLPISHENRIFVETVVMQGAISIALELLIQMAGFQARISELSSFFDIFLNRINVSENEFKRQGSMIGLDWHLPTCAFVLEPRTEFSLLNFRQIDGCVKSIDPRAVIYTRINQIIILYHPKNSSNDRAALAECRRLAQNILETINSKSYVHIGIGSMAVSSPEALKSSFNEAKECVTKARKLNADICTHDQLGMERFFPMFTDIDEVTSFAKKFLSPLLEFDTEKNAEIVKTLSVFLKNKFNKAKSANDLNIHINTLNYRLAKMEEMLNFNFEDMEFCSMLYLALKILETN